MLGFFSFYWSITHHNNLKGIKTISNRSKARFKINKTIDRTKPLVPSITFCLWPQLKSIRGITCIKVLCFAEISARIRSIHFSGWISLVLWVVGVEKSLSWITFEPEVLVQGVIGRGVVGGFQVTWSCWEKKITNGERYKWFISTIFSLYSISLHFRLEFFFFFLSVPNISSF